MISIAAIALPIFALLVGGWLLLEVSGRNRIANDPSIPKPLQSRVTGYDASDATTISSLSSG